MHLIETFEDLGNVLIREIGHRIVHVRAKCQFLTAFDFIANRLISLSSYESHRDTVHDIGA